MSRKRKLLDEVPDPERAKARALLCGSFGNGNAPSPGTKDEIIARLSEELERLIFQQSASSLSDYRAEMRKVVASLRRCETLRARLVQGEVKASHLLAEPQMLLTEEQRFLRAKVHQESLERCLKTSFGKLGYFLLGIDCDGSNCSITCERRHLESREQMRGRWPQLEKNHVVICAGPERSGSTWLYNAIRLLHLKAKVPCDSYWLSRLSRENLEERLRAKPAAVVLVKTHEWFEHYPDFIHMAKHVFLTHRDLRGVVASYRRVKWGLAIPDAYVAEHWEWVKRCSLDLSYEQIMRNALVPLKAIAERLNFNLTQEQFEEVHEDLQELKRSHCGNAVCQVTKLWPDHRSHETEELQGKGDSSNEQLNELKDPEYAQVLNSRFKEYQRFYGYIS